MGELGKTQLIPHSHKHSSQGIRGNCIAQRVTYDKCNTSGEEHNEGALGATFLMHIPHSRHTLTYLRSPHKA